ncbi:hypothetical protein B0A50_01124 [Salinomyces thailandicus]|uniref:Uncharacterized protein n=1 Tax=Salinomyces thailandicus TaxID=706561 RepID=A0A4U0UBX7_9PEZI|nr:hypothetical protein B0A50_01124 [Salinomyces thailandica]
MQRRADSPSSFQPPEAAGARQSAVPKPAYRLFPAVEPTPPASPASLQKAALARSESQRRRSVSLDDSTRSTAKTQQSGRRTDQLAARRGRNDNNSDLKPLSTVEELSLDSPTVPAQSTLKAATTGPDEGGHGRSSSAPIEALLGKQEKRGRLQQLWSNKTALASTESLQGFGLRLGSDERQNPALGRGPKRKLSLRLNTQHDEDSPPPPPPPKSPRHRHSRESSAASELPRAHSRNSSTHSQPSSRGQTPASVAQPVPCTTVKPTFVQHISKASHSASMRMPPTALESRESPSNPSSARSETVRPDHGRLRMFRSKKPAPLSFLSQPPAASTSSLPPGVGKNDWNMSASTMREGEKTPKVSALLSDAQCGPDGQTISRARDENGDVPLPTPQKDSLGATKPPTERQGARDRNIVTDSKLPPPAPFKIVRKAAPQQALSMENLRFEPTGRDPPPSPRSPVPPPKDSISETNRTPELPMRAASPEPTSLRKTIIDRPTPELPFRAGTPDLSARSDALPDPAHIIRDLAKQIEALHARYASLRSDRQKLSTGIVSSLKDQKAGPEYCNTLLDQHLSLAAINGSMDICFAKLKSLDCRKEDAMTTIIAQREAAQKEATARQIEDKVRKLGSAKPAMSLHSSTHGRSSPGPGVEGVKAQHPSSKLRKDSAHPQDLYETTRAKTSTERECSSSSVSTDKRTTIIRTPPSPISVFVEPPPATATSDSSASHLTLDETDSDTLAHSRKIRIKGAKAAQILGLLCEVASAQQEPPPPLESPTITLPDELDRGRKTSTPLQHSVGPSIEVQIPSSRLSVLPVFALQSPALATGEGWPMPPLPAANADMLGPSRSATASPSSSPSRAEATCGCRNNRTAEAGEPQSKTPASNPSSPIISSETHSRAGTAAESSEADETAFATPREQPESRTLEKPLPASPTKDREAPPPIGLKSAQRGQVQTFQVFVDEEILDYYHNASERLSLEE